MVDTNGVAAAEPEWALQRSIEGQLQPRYFCHPLDLRELPSSQNLESFRGLRSNLPTLIISECCLCYLDTENASDVVKWFGDRIPNLGIILYEPIGANDSFGQMMVENLAARGIVMPTIQRYKTLEDQKERLAEFGFTGGNGGGGNIAETIEDIWETWIDEQERERLNNLEGLDEVEEWQMLARHYCVAWGWRGDTWENWARSK
jgi:[phosphatase 2A protein]-leucine-carboxy methyltransferase